MSGIGESRSGSVVGRKSLLALPRAAASQHSWQCRLTGNRLTQAAELALIGMHHTEPRSVELLD